MPIFKYGKICKKMVCIFAAASILLAIIATGIGMIIGSLFGAVVGWVYSTVAMWFILDHYGYLLDSENVKEIRNNIGRYESLTFSRDGTLPNDNGSIQK